MQKKYSIPHLIFFLLWLYYHKSTATCHLFFYGLKILNVSLHITAFIFVDWRESSFETNFEHTGLNNADEILILTAPCLEVANRNS